MAAMDFSSIISTANAAIAKGKTKPAEWRRGQLRQLIKMLDENEEEMALAMHKDLRKPRNEAITYETEYTKNVCRQVPIFLSSVPIHSVFFIRDSLKMSLVSLKFFKNLPRAVSKSVS